MNNLSGRSFLQIMLLIGLGSALTFGMIYWRITNVPPTTAIVIGIMVGLVFGVGIGYHAQEYALSLGSSGQPGDPSLHLQLLLGRMGYRVETRMQHMMTFKPTLKAGLFADRIRVEFLGSQMNVSGPRHHITRLQNDMGG
ncbi:MAG: hypothetical protein IPI58_00990 [Alphaproteobacteria bacterium]|nr:MAG: hypothetical protein IPI58_00990 [Alphaproteobacteria bacterium]